MNWLVLKTMMKTVCTGDDMLEELLQVETLGYIWMIGSAIVVFGSCVASWRGE